MTFRATSDAVISQSREVADAIKAMHDTIRQFQIIDPLKEIRRTLKVIEMADPFKELREAIRLIQLHNPFREVQQAVAAIQQLPDPLLGFREHVRAFQSTDPLRPVREAIQELQALARAPAIQDAIRAMHSSTTAYRQLLQGTIPANFFEESFREAVARFARVETETGGNVGEVFDHLVGELEQDGQRTSKTLLSLEFWLNLLIALSILMYSLKTSEESEERLSRQIHAMQQAILEQVANPETHEFEKTYYVVERRVCLRSKPNTRKSNLLKILYPNQKVRLVDRKGKWICVEYFNYLNNLHENGWCMVKYLKRLGTVKNEEVKRP